MLFLSGSFGYLEFACEHKPAALFHGVNHDGERRLSTSTDCDGESRCRHFSMLRTFARVLLMTSAFTVHLGTSCTLVYAFASSLASMLL